MTRVAQQALRVSKIICNVGEVPSDTAPMATLCQSMASILHSARPIASFRYEPPGVPFSPGSGCSKWVPKSNSTTVDIDLVCVEAELLDAIECLRSEGFVELVEVNAFWVHA